MGGDQQDAGADAEAFGAAVAKAGYILCTGGRPGPGGATKNATMRGAHGADANARLIGFLPRGDGAEGWDRAHPRRLFVGTGLKSTWRNGFTGLTPDLMVIFPGSRGTLTEMAFARARGVPVLLWNSRAFLSANRRRHATARDGAGSVADQMADALKVLPEDIRDRFTADRLTIAMDDALAHADEVTGGAAAVTSIIGEILPGLETEAETGYPGLADTPEDKARFEAAVRALSGD